MGMDWRSFFGILPPKLPYTVNPLEAVPLDVPERLSILWSGGDYGDLKVQVGEEVKTGQDMAMEGKGPLVSTGTGRVESVNSFKGHDGNPWLEIVIAARSNDIMDPSIKGIEDLSQLSPEALRAAINRAGYPSLCAISNSPASWPEVDTLIISAMDTDLAGVVNQQVFRESKDDVAKAMELLSRAVEASRTLLAVPGNLSALAEKIVPDPSNRVAVPTVYPNGMREMLAIKYGKGRLLGKWAGGIIGNTLVIPVEEAVSILRNLQAGQPFMEKRVTFSGGVNGVSKNFITRIGTPISDLLRSAGIELERHGKLIVNGIMGGYTCLSQEQPVTAQTDSIHIQAPGEVYHFQDSPCINCGQCNAVCPVCLEASLLGRFSEYGIFEKCKALGAENCIECGLCAYVCPARRPLVHLISYARSVIERSMVDDTMGSEALEGDAACKSFETHCPTIKLFDSSVEKENSNVSHTQ